MDPSRYYHLSSFYQADVAFDDAPVCLGVSLTDKLVFAFLSGIRVFFRAFSLPNLRKRYGGFPLYLARVLPFVYFSLELAPRKAFGLLVLLG